MKELFRSQFLLFIFIILVAGCKKDDTEKQPGPVDVFYKTMSRLVIEVAYEPGAEPYDLKSTGENIWEFTELNIESLFAGRPIPVDVIVPNGIQQMTMLPGQNKTGFTLNDIKSLADHYRSSAGNEATGDIFVIFLNGKYKQGDTLVNNIMGLNITGTTITAIFKPLINISHVTKVVREYVEQSVVVHETGHALGLVNNGLPLSSAHEDENHKGHCSNMDCAMYWQNERSANVVNFVHNYGTGNKVIFGSECIQDVNSYFPE